jgi:hypothetical protein
VRDGVAWRRRSARTARRERGPGRKGRERR